MSTVHWHLPPLVCIQILWMNLRKQVWNISEWNYRASCIQTLQTTVAQSCLLKLLIVQKGWPHTYIWCLEKVAELNIDGSKHCGVNLSICSAEACTALQKPQTLWDALHAKAATCSDTNASYVIVTLVGSGLLGYTVKGTHTAPAVEKTISCHINASSIFLCSWRAFVEWMLRLV